MSVNTACICKDTGEIYKTSLIHKYVSTCFYLWESVIYSNIKAVNGNSTIIVSNS